MRVEQAEDLMWTTYFMVNWEKEVQAESEERCVQCGRPMRRLEAQVGEGGPGYAGLVCHGCKRVVWVRNG